MIINPLDIYQFISLDNIKQQSVLNNINYSLNYLTAQQRVNWCLNYLPKTIIMSSSFGINSVVLLHLITNIFPNIPVVLIDTGYLFPETYRFIENLTRSFKLNLQIFRAIKSPAWQEAVYGRLWKQGIHGIKYYNYINKVEPMNRALKELKVNTWISGLRRDQSSERKILPILSIQNYVFKFLPIIDWNNRQLYTYIKKFALNNHPLWQQGYITLGDTHTTKKFMSGMKIRDTRFFGLVRECGLHVYN